MKHAGIALALALVALFSAFSAEAAGPSAAAPDAPALKIGTFDSRAVALAFWRSEEGMKHLNGLHAELKEAKAEGDAERVKALEVEGPGLQVRMHQQVFSTGTVRDIVQKIEKEIPAIAAEAGVSVVVSRWELVHVDGAVEQVDLTPRLVALFDPSAKILEMIEEMAQIDPVPIEELSMDPMH